MLRQARVTNDFLNHAVAVHLADDLLNALRHCASGQYERASGSLLCCAEACLRSGALTTNTKFVASAGVERPRGTGRDVERLLASTEQLQFPGVGRQQQRRAKAQA